LGAQLGYRRIFLDEGAALAGLLGKRRHSAPEFVDSLLGTLVKVPTHAATMPAHAVHNEALIEPLSDAQLVILGLVASGLSNQEIADKLSITLGTTKWHLNQIYNILNVTSRTQAIAQAHRLNLL
jgi:LuxR family maltose regulon positive regulatory protein